MVQFLKQLLELQLYHNVLIMCGVLIYSNYIHDYILAAYHLIVYSYYFCQTIYCTALQRIMPFITGSHS